MKHSQLIQHLVVIIQVSALTLGTGQAQTLSNTTSATGLVSAAQAQSSRMKTVTNAQRKAAAAQARAQRAPLRAATKSAAKTRLAQPATTATVTAAAVASVAASPNAATVKAAVVTPSAMALTTAPVATTAAVATTLQPGQITDKAGNPILNQGTPIGVPGSTIANPNVCQPGILDYFNCGNFANSPLPEPAAIDNTDPTHPKPAVDANGFMIPAPGTGIRKFVDTLAGVGAGNANNLGNYIPIATPSHATLANGTVDTAADYYEIELKRYKQQMHSDLPQTVLQGYHDAAGADSSFHYLGPMIFAKRDIPVRVKFTNSLPTGANGNLYLPIDKTMKGSGVGPDGKTSYTENRALLHLHGGITPWISDGTPHQWITPASEPTTLKKGVSQQNVPDMVQPPADGSGGWDTWYYTNQQSARLLWYHDHSYAATRHNVYAGEAAPYLISDKWEDDLINGTNLTGTNPNQMKLIPDQAGLDKSGQGAYHYGIPLVIQDKTFVPPTVDKTGKLPAPYAMDQLMAEDPTWFSSTDSTGTHPVISTVDGTNDSILGQYGQLWFPHVFMPNQNPNDPNTVVNGYGRWDYGAWVWPPVTGLKYPPITNAVDPVTGATITIPPFPNPSAVQEAFMDTPLVNGTAYPKMTVGTKAYRFRILNASNDRHWNLQFYYATDAKGNVCKPAKDASACTEVKMIPSAPVHGMPATWPTDGRDGGVPDWTTAGPDIIQIGSDSGLLPTPVTIPSQPVNYEYNRRVITTLNVKDHALLLGPAERADVVVDFSSVPDGAVLILYNDAPAPNPGFDSRLDYYTGNPDQSDSGGTPSTIPGYGPNTRTVMQFIVSAAADGGSGTSSFDIAKFTTAMKAVYPSEQKAPLVPAKAYGNGSNIYAKIQDVTFDMTTNTFVDASVNTGTDTVINMKPKAIAEEFDTDWGRMTAQLGVELPFTNFLTQTTLQMWMFDPPTEIATAHDGAALNPNDIQIWRVTHNGVDTHSVHYHMFDVQLINRVAWDGTMYPPDANEMGWKETVRMNPLTDAIIALRPIKPTLPFSLTDSFRPLDPTSPVDTAGPTGTTPAFTNIDPLTNNPITVSNQLVNFGWEYVWHCHLLGHEENDMMRPIVVKVEPEAPTAAGPTRNSDFSVHLTWTNTAASATGFDIQRATDSLFTKGLTTFHMAPSVTMTSQIKPGTAESYDDTTASPTVPYYYRVAATKLFNDPVMETASTNILYSVWSNAVQAPIANVPSATVAPGSLTFGITPLNQNSASQAITVGNTGNANLLVTGVSAAGNFTQTNTCSSVTPGTTCTITVAFRPTASGTRTGTVTFNTNDPQHPAIAVPVSGMGTALVLNPTALTYGLAAATQTFTVQNLGTTTLTGLAFTKTGANATDFTVTTPPAFQGGCAATLAGGRTCTVSVRFGGATSIRSASVNVASNDPAGAQAVSLTGGVAPSITLNATALNFGSVNLNTTPAAQTFTVTSSGNWPVTISGVALVGLNANQFAQTSNCPVSLAVGSSCTVSVTFTPTVVGAKSGTVTVNVGSPATQKSVILAGLGVNPNPSITVSPTSWNAFTGSNGTVSKQFTVTSNGGSPVQMAAAAAIFEAGSNPRFTITANTCNGQTLNVFQTCSVTVSFTAPTQRGIATASGTLDIVPVSAAATTQKISLTVIY